MPDDVCRDVILVQEDDSVLAAWMSALKAGGYTPHPRPTLETGLESILDSRAWFAMVVDLGFRGPEALAFLQKLKAEPRVVPVILIAWEENLEKSPHAAGFPQIRFLKNPLHPRLILEMLKTIKPPPPVQKQKSSGKSFIIHHTGGTLKPMESLTRTDILPAARAEMEAGPKVDPKMAHELERAQQIQSALLPATIPQPGGFEIAAQYLPAEEVGGDYYDVIELPGGKVAMLVADVSGKGISAAMVMVMARTVLHSVAPTCSSAKQLATSAAARIAKDLPGGIFISSAIAILDPGTAQVSVVNCGHMPPLQWAVSDGRPYVSALDVSGGAIGLVKGAIFERTLKEVTIVMQPGEQLVFYTDGVNEAMDEKNEEYGDKRLTKAVKTSGGGSAEEMVQGLVDSVLYHRGDAVASDDLTVLVLKRK